MTRGRPTSSATHGTVPVGRFTFFTLVEMIVKPPHTVHWDSSATAEPLGTLPPIALLAVHGRPAT